MDCINPSLNGVLLITGSVSMENDMLYYVLYICFGGDGKTVTYITNFLRVAFPDTRCI
jgi:hypothetical protein